MSVSFREYPGWTGCFTREQAANCYPNGTRVVKIAAEREDTHPNSSRATVLGSINPPGRPELGAAYFVEWDNHPGIAVLIVARKIKPLAH